MSTATCPKANAPERNRSRQMAWLCFALAPVVAGPLWVALAPADARFVNGSVSEAILALLLTVAVITDITWRRIPNWATYPAFAWALGINAVAWLAGQEAWGAVSGGYLGTVGLGESLTGGFGLLLMMFFVFSITGGGAGDVKLVACLGALLGWQTGMEAVLYAYIIGGAVSISVALIALGPGALLEGLVCGLGHLVAPHRVSPPAIEVRRLFHSKIPLAPFFAGGALLAIWQGGLLERIFG